MVIDYFIIDSRRFPPKSCEKAAIFRDPDVRREKSRIRSFPAAQSVLYWAK
jgi:hypothetical protein